MSKWVLAEIITYGDYAFTNTMSPDEMRVRFVRELKRRGSKQPKRDSIIIAIMANGGTTLYHNFSATSMKRERRQRMHALACQAIAYWQLMGSVEGFPEQEFL